jgi:hypothetical protein
VLVEPFAITWLKCSLHFLVALKWIENFDLSKRQRIKIIYKSQGVSLAEIEFLLAIKLHRRYYES